MMVTKVHPSTDTNQVYVLWLLTPVFLIAVILALTFRHTRQVRWLYFEVSSAVSQLTNSLQRCFTAVRSLIHTDRIQEQEDTIRRLNRYNEELKQRIVVVEQERNDALTRLSSFMGSHFRANNPNVADLSDQFRPTKLAEISSELYDNEWTNAFCNLGDSGFTDVEGIQILLDIVMVTYTLCSEWSRKQWEDIDCWLGDTSEGNTLLVKQTLIEGRKSKIGKYLQHLQQEVIKTLKSCVQEKKLGSLLSTAGPVRVYLDACVRLCLYMVVQDPPVVWYCPMWSPKYFVIDKQSDQANQLTGQKRERFNTKLFRPYMKSGRFVEFTLWPAMLIQDGGSTLCKGVAQGCT